MSALTFSDLLTAGVHFGHLTYRCNPKMFPYIYAEQNNVHIIDLLQTSRFLAKATSFVSDHLVRWNLRLPLFRNEFDCRRGMPSGRHHKE